MEEKNDPTLEFMRKKQILSERKSGDAAKIYINSSSDEDDLADILKDLMALIVVNFSLPHLPLNIFPFTSTHINLQTCSPAWAVDRITNWKVLSLGSL